MAKYRKQLPQLSNNFFITTGGLETSLVYCEKVDLPCFASCDVLKDPSKCQWMKNYLGMFVQIAQKYQVGVILESPTWRASPDWLTKIGYSAQDVNDINRKAIELLSDVRKEYEKTDKYPIVINAAVGPRGDGYNPTVLMSAEDAQKYHAIQIGALSQTNADMITGFTMNYPEEAIGIVRAAKEIGIPVAISFTVETNGKLATGHTLKEAIELVDNATQNTPVYYMINCAHPNSFIDILVPEEAWVGRIRGVKGNASKKSHAELNESKELDSGDPVEFAEYNRALLYKMKNLNMIGGCCGTDYHHVEEVCKACVTVFDQLKHTDQ